MTTETARLDTKTWALVREAVERCFRGESDRQEITGKNVRAVVYAMKNNTVPVRIDLYAR